ncbi:DUF3231 family protein [Halobacillus amylolyticus]|uniref:DUF3231 family protein n=1 Tax=Halobacillus amylolyticus TaxID=2932259 RepID=A0ABY4HG69_9BACI|nr:DUF3231 family protein [Halobacillus amylolyticus]UOR13652.1 DUF3231 family protein [Halobacillus amylolyticus]
METEHNIRLTSAEMSYLWTTYQADTMSICMVNHFLQHIDDMEIKRVATHALDISQQHVEIIRQIFTDEAIQIPQAFGDQDVNLKAKRLFSDDFYLQYIKHMSKGGLATFSRALPNIYRQDILSFFSKCMTSTMELNNEVTQLLLEKGIAVRPPYIPSPKGVDFVQKQSFMLEGLGNGRALTGIEISDLYSNIQTNQLGVALATGFSQVVESNKVRKYILRGKDIALKHIKVFSDYLSYNSLPVPTSLAQGITESKESPFSDKLIMYHFSLMMYSGIGNYGVAISESQKSDLAIDYSRLLTETLKYAEDGVNIMIANKWLEKPPTASNRKDLAKD